MSSRDGVYQSKSIPMDCVCTCMFTKNLTSPTTDSIELQLYVLVWIQLLVWCGTWNAGTVHSVKTSSRYKMLCSRTNLNWCYVLEYHMRLKHSYLSGIKMSLKLVNHCVYLHQEFIKNWIWRERGVKSVTIWRFRFIVGTRHITVIVFVVLVTRIHTCLECAQLHF